ncbi:MAG: site-specific integrase [Bacilli bacterium]|nr:site-specific integrase [Bacilli bacterium]
MELDIKTFVEEHNGKLIILDMLKDIDFGVQYDINNYQDVSQQVLNPSTNNKDSEWYISSPKTNSSNRTIPVPDVLLKDLLELKKSNEAFKKFKLTWFVLGDDQPITTHQFYSRRDLYASKAGLKRIRIHDFRHSCTSILISASTPITAVSNFLGHADSTETLETYAHLIKKDYQKITNYFDNMEQQYNQKSEE